MDRAPLHAASPAPTIMPPGWRAWLDRGWNGVSAADWVRTWLPSQLASTFATLGALEKEHSNFARVARREKRNVLDRLIRSQHLLPWFSKKRTPFFREGSLLVTGNGVETAFDHPIPVMQLKSLIEMAVAEDGMVQAVERLVFAWLCPPALVTAGTKGTHAKITSGENRLCHNFDLPLSRYKGVDIIRFDDTAVDASSYTRSKLIEDLCSLRYFDDLHTRLADLSLPDAEDEILWTKANVRTRSEEGSLDACG